MNNEYKNIWVVCEVDQEGKAKNVGVELLTPALEMAETIGEEVVSVVIGPKVDQAVEELKEHGPSKIITVSGPDYEEYNTEVYTHALESLVKKYKPHAMLIGATNQGRDLGPRLAARLKTGLTADCTELSIDEETKGVTWTRPAFGGNLMANIICPDHRPEIGTVRPGVFKKTPVEASQEIEVVQEDISYQGEVRTRIVERLEKEQTELVNLEGAEIIVSFGRGIGESENIAIIEDLAHALGATLGSSRAAVDAGWISHAHQVGQSGTTVGPKVYFAIGISGAIQHLAGITGADYVIAINTDKDAAIFGVADYGIVGDFKEIVPRLTESILAIKANK